MHLWQASLDSPSLSSSAVLPEAEVTPERTKERPLAARRNMIQSNRRTNAEPESAVDNKTEGAGQDDERIGDKATAGSGGVDLDAELDSVMKKTPTSSSVRPSSSSIGRGDSSPKVEFVSKTTKQIEDEIRKHTAAFDEQHGGGGSKGLSIKNRKEMISSGNKSTSAQQGGDQEKDTVSKVSDAAGENSVQARKPAFVVPIQVPVIRSHRTYR
jgi:hypothetical protein